MRFSASISFLFTERPFLERFAAAREAGFEGVEIQFLPDIDIAEITRAARDAQVEIVVLNVGMGDLFDGGPGLSGVPGREAQFARELSRALEAAEQLRPRYFHVGPSRVPSGVSTSSCLTTYVENMRAAVNGVRALRGATQLVIEAMNHIDMPDALVPNVGSAVALVGDHFRHELRLMFDIYHVAMNGEDVLRCFAQHQALIAHVQFSNMPGRHEPGCGSLDIEQLISAIAATGYNDWIGAEYRPTKVTGRTLEWLNRVRSR